MLLSKLHTNKHIEVELQMDELDLTAEMCIRDRWGICRKFYSAPTLCWKLAKYNGIQNANLIYPGQILKIPEKKELG